MSIIDDNKYDLYNKNQKIGHFEVQIKKAKITFISNQLELSFIAGNNESNNKNLKIIESSL